MLKQLEEKFFQIYPDQVGKEIRAFFSPGRVNLIGEHIDYNGGHVMPCALEIGTYVVVRMRNDEKIRLYSENFPEEGIIEVTTGQLEYDENNAWANYPLGVIKEMTKSISNVNGMDLYFVGTIPNGAGLSSSASIELATAFMMNRLYELSYTRLELVQLSQKVENEFIGVNCGIMDQFAVGFGRKEKAILLNCDHLTYDYLPLPLKGAKIVIANTNKKRGLADSAYNDRRTTCENALLKIQSIFSIEQLAELSSKQLEQVEHLLTEEEYKRVRHVVTENERTLKAVTVLQEGDVEAFGALMKASHLSLKEDYEVTGVELDTLVEAAWNHPGTIGARMTGAGFGGCTVNIVKDEEVDSFLSRVGSEYAKKIGYEASFYVVDVGDGVKELTENLEVVNR
ncbi:galactokinase [Bacillus kexueae]|uniref:galactokinase n=1 Tax=Aeribacillus kexueae TaxID=2078952 RepID=UPI001FAF7792|nr:galactokinase [Bacillus kexueae]